MQRKRSLRFGRAGEAAWEIAWKGQDHDSPGPGDARKGEGGGLRAERHAPVGCSHEKVSDDLGRASFRKEVGAEEGCVHSTNNGIRVRLEERDLFPLSKEERRKTRAQRQVCLWGVGVVPRLCEERFVGWE